MFWLLASSCSDRRGSRVQHIGSHPHSPGLCGRRASYSPLHRLADLPDVYALLASRPYDAILDVFLALPPMPLELHALRFLLACSGRGLTACPNAHRRRQRSIPERGGVNAHARVNCWTMSVPRRATTPPVRRAHRSPPPPFAGLRSPRSLSEPTGSRFSCYSQLSCRASSAAILRVP
jgi:hypothetical protein